MPGYQLTDELARYCLHDTGGDAARRLAWVNSICILFLLIGVFGGKLAEMRVKPLPPLEEVVPAIIEPAPPPQKVAAAEARNEPREEKSEARPAVVVTPDVPSITFSVPTIGTLIAPAALAEAPPLRPLQPQTPVARAPARVGNTGTGGQRPSPPYPKLAQEQAEQGTVTLLMTADEVGNIVSIELKQSSGFPILDRATLDFIKRHWTLPVGTGSRMFETSITYQLQTN